MPTNSPTQQALMASSYMTKYRELVKSGASGWVLLKMLGLWKGSLYKLVWVDLLMYIVVYYILNFTYRFGMNSGQKQVFEDIVKYCKDSKDSIQISFLLGFFVSGVISRWYQMYIYIPWLNKMSFSVMACMNNRDDVFIKRSRVSIMRYVNLAWILAMRQISDQIAGRFSPKKQAVKAKSQQKAVKAASDAEGECEDFLDPGEPLDPFDIKDNSGVREILQSINQDKKVRQTFKILVTEAEIRTFESISHKAFAKNRSRYVLEYWVPITWAVRIVQKAALHGMVSDPKIAFAIIDEIGRLRQQLQDLQIYSSIMIPLVYTQVVIIATYSYFMCQMFSSQFIRDHTTHGSSIGPNVTTSSPFDLAGLAQTVRVSRSDMFVPIFSICSFFFYMGWLKVVMCVMNPFGDDDEDFQTSFILDCNLSVSHQCAEMDQRMYPTGLSPPDTEVKLLPGHENDDLEKYLNQVAFEADAVPEYEDEHRAGNARPPEQKSCCF